MGKNERWLFVLEPPTIPSHAKVFVTPKREKEEAYLILGKLGENLLVYLQERRRLLHFCIFDVVVLFVLDSGSYVSINLASLCFPFLSLRALTHSVRQALLSRAGKTLP